MIAMPPFHEIGAIKNMQRENSLPVVEQRVTCNGPKNIHIKKIIKNQLNIYTNAIVFENVAFILGSK